MLSSISPANPFHFPFSAEALERGLVEDGDGTGRRVRRRLHRPRGAGRRWQVQFGVVHYRGRILALGGLLTDWGKPRRESDLVEALSPNGGAPASR